jgi:phytoene dehydrogenase-like protein
VPRPEQPDAIVIGAGPNGLVAANVLADAGWSVVILEANRSPGGAVRTAEVTAPGFASDLFSAFYPLAAASPVLASLDLGDYGLAWSHAPAVVAHPRWDRPAALLSRDLDTTAANLEHDAPGEGDRYRALYERWSQIARPFMDSLLAPFPPVGPGARLALAAGPHGMLNLARTALMPVRRLVDEEFRGEAAGLLVAGNALHADLTPDMSGSALFGWMLVGLGQQLGFPVPVGGAGALTDALVRRARARGAELRLECPVSHVAVSAGRATGVVLADGTHLGCRTVLADCDAPTLLLRMVGPDHLPDRWVRGLQRFQRAHATVKVDWALSAPVPWSDPLVSGAGTVHIADSLDELTASSAQLAMNQIPDKPFVVAGQMTTADPTRSPMGTESMWAYTHVPQHPVGDAGADGLTGEWKPAHVARFAERIEARIERLAPGFRDRIITRYVQGPRDLERVNRNLVGGDISGGTAQLHQQLLFRPAHGFARAETPIRDLYLASASAHPGGGVHGACGNNAARAALLHHPLMRIARGAARHVHRPRGEGLM